MKKTSILLITSSSMMGLASNSWLSMWIMMELSTLSFSYKMFEEEDMESSSMYFMIQMMSAIMILTFIIMKTKYEYPKLMSKKKMILLIFLLTKMGMFPFHWLMLKISQHTKMNNLFILLSIQKIIPLKMMSMTKMNMTMFILISINAILSMTIMYENSSLNIILFSSSMNQTSMMSILSQINISYCILYLIMYSSLIFMMIKEMKKMNLKSLNQFKKNNKSMMFLISNISGFPMSISFWMKIIFLKIIFMSSISKMIILMFFSMYFILSTFYMRMIFNEMMMNKTLMPLKMSTKSNMTMMLLIFIFSMI